MAVNPEELRAEVENVGFWYHSVELPGGVTTPGWVTPEKLADQREQLAIPDLRGKSVLDIGSWDGYYAFLAESRGASRVVALDHFAWFMDNNAWVAYREELKAKGEQPALYSYEPFWDEEGMPGKAGFDLCKQALGSGVEDVVGDFMTMDLERLGTFDVVFFLGILYHLKEPLLAVERLASLTDELAVIETAATYTPGLEGSALCTFWEGAEYGDDPTNFWGPNARALEGMCRAAGFRDAKVIVGPPDPKHLAGDAPTPYRAIAHARK